MAQALARGLRWAIVPAGDRAFVCGPGAPVAPMLGRRFRFGVTDCYALCRDVLRGAYGIELRDYPREWGFWAKGVAYYERHFEREGLRCVPAEVAWPDLRPGAMLLFRLRSAVANHAGIYTGHGMMIHHLGAGLAFDPSRLSAVVSVARWRRVCSGVLIRAA